MYNTHPAHQHWVRSSVLLNHEELIPDPSSFGPVKYLPFPPSLLSMSMERKVTYEHKHKHEHISVRQFKSPAYFDLKKSHLVHSVLN